MLSVSDKLQPLSFLTYFRTPSSSLKYHFFLSQSSFLTHFLDLSLSELAKSARSASLVKLQSLLELTLRTSAGSPLAESELKDDVRVVMASEKLYEFLGKIINQKTPFAGGAGDDGDGGEGNGNAGSIGAASGRTSRADDTKKDLIGSLLTFPHAFLVACLICRFLSSDVPEQRSKPSNSTTPSSSPCHSSSLARPSPVIRFSSASSFNSSTPSFDSLFNGPIIQPKIGEHVPVVVLPVHPLALRLGLLPLLQPLLHLRILRPQTGVLSRSGS